MDAFVFFQSHKVSYFFYKVLRKLFIATKKTYAFIRILNCRCRFMYCQLCGQYFSLKPESTWDYCKKQRLPIHILYPETKYKSCIVSCCLQNNKLKPEKYIIKSFLPVYAVELTNATVIGEETDMVVHNKAILTDRFHYSPRDMDDIVFSTPYLKNLGNGTLILADVMHQRLESGIFLNTRWCRNIYHFIYDILLKLMWIEKCEQYKKYPILLGPHSLDEPSRLDLLKKFNTNGHNVIVLDDRKIYKVDKLVIVSLEHFAINEHYINGAPWFGGFYHYASLLKFRDYWPMNKGNGTRKFFFIRPHNDRLVNESEIAQFFKGKGFSIVNPGLYSYEEQVLFFQDAKWIVATHGACLCNIIHCPPNAIVVQITCHPILQNLDYNNLGCGVGIRVINFCADLIRNNHSWTAPGIQMRLRLKDAEKIFDFLSSSD